MDHRHPQLDSVFTLAQNLKNKTSSSDIRTEITEKSKFIHPVFANAWISWQ